MSRPRPVRGQAGRRGRHADREKGRTVSDSWAGALLEARGPPPRRPRGRRRRARAPRAHRLRESDPPHALGRRAAARRAGTRPRAAAAPAAARRTHRRTRPRPRAGRARARRRAAPRAGPHRRDDDPRPGAGRPVRRPAGAAGGGPGRGRGAPARGADQRGARHPLRCHRRGQRRRGRRPRASGAPLARAAMSDSPATPAVVRVRTEAGREWPVLVREFGPGWRAVSTALLGGGLGPCAWWLDAQVDKEYFNPDPVAHARSIAAGLGLDPDAGCAMLTAADVRRWTAGTDEGVEVAATVGLGLPVLAAVPPEVAELEGRAAVGTINILVVVPAALSDA